jgi:hypothetical protein
LLNATFNNISEEVQNNDDKTQLPNLHFETLVDEGVSCISDSIEVLTTSEENDNDCLSEEADDQSSTKIVCFSSLSVISSPDDKKWLPSEYVLSRKDCVSSRFMAIQDLILCLK